MSLLTTVAGVPALLGCGIIGGVFFAFSGFIMKALARVPAPGGIAAMQSINVVVLNRSFLGVFMGTALLSVLLAGVAAIEWGTAPAPWFLAGALLYLGGTFLVTGLGNVPLNNELAALASTDPAAIAVWERYLDRWTRLNTIRTAAATAAALMYILGFLTS